MWPNIVRGGHNSGVLIRERAIIIVIACTSYLCAHEYKRSTTSWSFSGFHVVGGGGGGEANHNSQFLSRVDPQKARLGS